MRTGIGWLQRLEARKRAPDIVGQGRWWFVAVGCVCVSGFDSLRLALVQTGEVTTNPFTRTATSEGTGREPRDARPGSWSTAASPSPPSLGKGRNRLLEVLCMGRVHICKSSKARRGPWPRGAKPQPHSLSASTMHLVAQESVPALTGDDLWFYDDPASPPPGSGDRRTWNRTGQSRQCWGSRPSSAAGEGSRDRAR